MDNILEVRGLKMHFGGVKAVDELSFDVHRHELLGVIGPNGSGKTTMFNALTGVYKPTDGKVTFNGIDITGKPLDSMVNYGIARTFQNLRVFKAMTVLDNIMIGNSKNIHTNLFDAALHTPRYRKYEKESLEKARELLSLLGLSRWENEYVGSIPYGIQKRIEFARAVIVEPQLLLLDEPAAGLNSKEAEDLMQMILWVKDKKGFTVILIDHNMKIMMSSAERILVMEAGRELAVGLPKDIQNNPREVKASNRGLFPSGAGSHGMATGNVVYQVADTYAAGFGCAAKAIEKILRDDTYSLDQVKDIFMTLYGSLTERMGGKSPNGAAYMNMPKVWRYYSDIVDSIDN